MLKDGAVCRKILQNGNFGVHMWRKVDLGLKGLALLADDLGRKCPPILILPTTLLLAEAYLLHIRCG